MKGSWRVGLLITFLQVVLLVLLRPTTHAQGSAWPTSVSVSPWLAAEGETERSTGVSERAEV